MKTSQENSTRRWSLHNKAGKHTPPLKQRKRVGGRRVTMWSTVLWKIFLATVGLYSAWVRQSLFTGSCHVPDPLGPGLKNEDETQSLFFLQNSKRSIPAALTLGSRYPGPTIEVMIASSSLDPTHALKSPSMTMLTGDTTVPPKEA